MQKITHFLILQDLVMTYDVRIILKRVKSEFRNVVLWKFSTELTQELVVRQVFLEQMEM